jgi:hypothetical protein
MSTDAIGPRRNRRATVPAIGRAIGLLAGVQGQLSLNQSTTGYVLPAPGERRPASFSSVLSRMDRLVVLDRGRIVEQGSHDELLRQNGHYAALWRRQSGGFIDVAAAQAAE